MPFLTHRARRLFSFQEFAQEYDGATAKLTIPDAYVDDSGEWTCEAWNEVGQATQNVRVTIKGEDLFGLPFLLLRAGRMF